MNVPPLVLISEFVTVDHGKYIVKLSCHSNSVIIGSALASGNTVEQAEDNARARVLDLVKQNNTSTSTEVEVEFPPVPI